MRRVRRDHERRSSVTVDPQRHGELAPHVRERCVGGLIGGRVEAANDRAPGRDRRADAAVVDPQDGL